MAVQILYQYPKTTYLGPRFNNLWNSNSSRSDTNYRASAREQYMIFSSKCGKRGSYLMAFKNGALK